MTDPPQVKADGGAAEQTLMSSQAQIPWYLISRQLRALNSLTWYSRGGGGGCGDGGMVRFPGMILFLARNISHMDKAGGHTGSGDPCPHQALKSPTERLPSLPETGTRVGLLLPGSLPGVSQ